MPEQEGVDEVGAGGYELKVVTIGHLSCDDSGSVACEEHLIVPGHDRGMRQDEIAEVTSGEGERGSDGDQPAELCSTRRFNLRGVVKVGRCCDHFAHSSALRPFATLLTSALV